MLERVSPVYDLCLVGGAIADVRSGVLRRAAVAIAGTHIGAVGEDEALAAEARTVLDVSGRVIVPGYIEPHTHIILANPVEFIRAVLPRGTTTAVVDALPLMVLAKPHRLPELLTDLAALPLKLRWLIRLHPQSFSDSDRFAPEHLRQLWRLPSAAAVGEVTRWVDVLAGDADLLEKIRLARDDGRRVEGHAAGASFDRLAALAAAGVTSDHEAVTAQEVADRLRAGLYVMLRHSSIRPDLPILAEATRAGDAGVDRIMLTADGPSPAFIEAHGYMDHVIEIAIHSGIPPLAALRMATLNPAAYYGMADAGEIAPGNRADLNVLAAIDHPRPVLVVADGRIVARDGVLESPLPRVPWSEFIPPLRVPELSAEVLAAPAGVPGLRLVNSVITAPLEPDRVPTHALHAALIDRRGRWITRGRLAGFVDRLGGLATTVSSGFDIIVLGQHPADMALALRRLADLGGGLVIAEGNRVVYELPLEAVIYSTAPWAEVARANREFNDLMRARGYRHSDPIFVPLFLTFDSLPWIRLTSRGVWDVRGRRVLAPSQPLDAGPR